MSEAVRNLPRVLLPQICPGCLRVGPAPCPRCIAALTPAPRLPPPEAVDRSVSLFAYDGVGAQIVRRLKYANHRDAVVALGRALAARLGDDLAATITWMPSPTAHRRGRGYEPARLIADAVGPAERLLARTDGVAQTERSRAGRLVGPSLVALRAIAGPVVVVDDVRTTGASLRSAAVALRARGATRVIAATVAVTPAPLRTAASTMPRSASHLPTTEGGRWCRSA